MDFVKIRWNLDRNRSIAAVVLLLAVTAAITYFSGYEGTEVSTAAGTGARDEEILKENQRAMEALQSANQPQETDLSSDTPSEQEGVPNIRVLLHTSNYDLLLHDEILITSSQTFTMKWEGEEQLCAGDSIITIRPDDARLAQGILTISGEGGLQLVSVKRDCGYPIYPGIIEIRADGGKLAVVNELPLERYLELVVPGEMPSSFGVEALKVQAVCARSYAWCQMQSMGYEKYNAHVDDSTNFQVYNNQPSSEAASQAVQETAGQVVSYEGQVVNTYYFSTSCGYTTDMDVWSADPAAYPYYPAAAMSVDRQTLDLTQEEAFRTFIDSYTDSFDQTFGFYRWQVDLDMGTLTSSINAYLSRHGMASVGTVTSLEVTSRGAGGIVKELTVTGTEGKAVLMRQGAVREALGSRGMVIHQLNGGIVETWSMLPSAFLYLKEIQTEGGLSGYEIHGGGYGHGVGMSQNGVSGMVKAGYAYTDILAYFYQGISLREIY